MCGIGGIIAPKAKPEWKQDVLRRLLIGASTRGQAATGIAFVQDGQLKHLKDGKTAREFANTKEFDEITQDLPPIVMGHARAATGGVPAGPEKNENNHPFVGEQTGIAVIHNGVIQDERWRKTVGKEKGLLEKYPFTGKTDSELFLRMVESMLDDGTTSMVNAISDSCFNITGGYALVWLRASDPNKIWFTKHKGDMVLAYNPKAPYIVFGSTKDIIDQALTSWEFRLDWFMEPHPPRVIYEDMAEDTILEVTLLDKANERGDLFTIEEHKFIACEDKYRKTLHGAH